GWYHPPRQTAGDFLIAITNPNGRQVRDGMESQVLCTVDEFAEYWKESPQYAYLKEEIAQRHQDFPRGGEPEKNLSGYQTVQTGKECPTKESIRYYYYYYYYSYTHLSAVLARRSQRQPYRPSGGRSCGATG